MTPDRQCYPHIMDLKNECTNGSWYLLHASAFFCRFKKIFERSRRTVNGLPMLKNAGRGGFFWIDPNRFGRVDPCGEATEISTVFFCGVFFFFIDIYATLIFISQQEIHIPLFFVYSKSASGNASPHRTHCTGNRSRSPIAESGPDFG